MPDLSRRFVLSGLIAAPSIVRCSSLMRVVAVPKSVIWTRTNFNRIPLWGSPSDPLNQLRVVGWKISQSGRLYISEDGEWGPMIARSSEVLSQDA
jgi:hypothetical protein